MNVCLDVCVCAHALLTSPYTVAHCSVASGPAVALCFPGRATLHTQPGQRPGRWREGGGGSSGNTGGPDSPLRSAGGEWPQSTGPLWAWSGRGRRRS